MIAKNDSAIIFEPQVPEPVPAPCLPLNDQVVVSVPSNVDILMEEKKENEPEILVALSYHIGW